MNYSYSLVRVLVTGGAGFIGSHLVETLVKAGAHVTVLDDLSTGSLDNLEKVKHQITFIHGTITEYQTCLSATHNCDLIFHLAAFISVPESIHNPTACYTANIVGTLNILQAMEAQNVSRIVFSSSSAVYGATNGICTETTPCNPTSPYGHSKWIGELMCHGFTQSSHLTAIILRYFNVYGERQNPRGQYASVVAQFKDRMRHNQPLIIYGDGLQERDFIPVQEVVQANMTAGLLPLARQSYETFNIGSGTSITLLELIERLKMEFPFFNAGIQFFNERTGDIKVSKADCSKFTLAKQTVSYSANELS